MHAWLACSPLLLLNACLSFTFHPLPCPALPCPTSLPPLQVRTAYVTHAREGARTEVTGGLRDLKVLKTTQSGYSGFKKDRFTTLPDVEDRIVASSVTATWK